MKLALVKTMLKYYTWRRKIDDRIIDWLKIKRYVIQAEVDIMNMRRKKYEKQEMGTER